MLKRGPARSFGAAPPSKFHLEKKLAKINFTEFRSKEQLKKKQEIRGFEASYRNQTKELVLKETK